MSETLYDGRGTYRTYTRDVYDQKIIERDTWVPFVSSLYMSVVGCGIDISETWPGQIPRLNLTKLTEKKSSSKATFGQTEYRIEMELQETL